jgi:hypothetical protein
MTFRLLHIEYIEKETLLSMLLFEHFVILNEDVSPSNPDMLPLETKLPYHAEVIDFTQNQGAMLVKKNSTTKVIRMSCEASDYRIGWPEKKQGFWGKFPKGLIHFNFVKSDWDGSHEDLYGSNYVSDTGKYTLLIVND